MICFPAVALNSFKEICSLNEGTYIIFKKNEEWRLPAGAMQVLLGLNF